MQGFPTAFAPLLRFLLVGVLNTAFGYLLFALLLALGLKVPLALLLATVGGVLFNFQTIGRLVFRSDAPLRRLARFVTVYAATYVLNLALLDTLERTLSLPPLWAQLLCIPAVVTFSFLLLRAFVFTQSDIARDVP